MNVHEILPPCIVELENDRVTAAYFTVDRTDHCFGTERVHLDVEIRRLSDIEQRASTIERLRQGGGSKQVVLDILWTGVGQIYPEMIISGYNPE